MSTALDISGVVALAVMLGAMGADQLLRWHSLRRCIARGLRRCSYRLMRASDAIEYPGMTSYQIRQWRMVQKRQRGYVWCQRYRWSLVRP